jgi:hypothetical protein
MQPIEYYRELAFWAFENPRVDGSIPPLATNCISNEVQVGPEDE